MNGIKPPQIKSKCFFDSIRWLFPIMYGEFQPQSCESQNLFLLFQSFNALIYSFNISLGLHTDVLNHLFLLFLWLLFDLRRGEVTFGSVDLIVVLLLHDETALVDDRDVVGLAGLWEVRVAWVAWEVAAAVVLVEKFGVLALVGWLKNPFLL